MPRRTSSLINVSDGAIAREVDSKYDAVKVVADNIGSVVTDANSIASINVVAENIDAIQSIGSISATMQSLYADKPTLDSLFADKATLDGLYADKSMIDGVYAELPDIGVVSDNIGSIVVDAANIAAIQIVSNDLTNSAASIEDNGFINDAIAESTGSSKLAVVAANISSVQTIAPIIADVVAVSAIDTEVTTVATIASDIPIVAAIAGDVSAVASIASDVTTAVIEIVPNIAAILLADDNALIASNKATDATNAFLGVDKKYLGSKSVAPTVDNQGASLVAGAMYFSTVDNLIKLWTGTAWVSAVTGDTYSITAIDELVSHLLSNAAGAVQIDNLANALDFGGLV